MTLFDRFRETFTGKRMCTLEHLSGYKRLGEQVFEVEVELVDTMNVRARVFLRAAKSLQVMGDALLRDAFPSEKRPSKPVPIVTHEQAEAWYERIPDLLIAARQESSFAGSSKIRVPILLGDREESSGTCPIEHLAGMRRAADEMENLVRDKIVFARTRADHYRRVILLYEEARTRRQSGDAIIGSIVGGQRVSSQSHEEAEEQYGSALTAYFLIAQALEDPTLLDQPPESVGKKKSRLDSRDLFKVTSRIALREIRQSGEYTRAQVDLAELWVKHTVTDVEREYERMVEELVAAGQIEEDGYWYCCPFQPVYKVIHGPVEVIGKFIPTGHVFVWDYGEDGAPGRFITQSTFGKADSRHYCED